MYKKPEITKSTELLNVALEIIPKGTQTASKCYNQFVRGVHPNFVNKSKGAYIWDVDGNKYIDHVMALGPIILGYNYKRTNEAIKKQLKNGIIFSLPHELEVQLAKLICEVVPCAEMVRFGKNGSDITSIAVRMARHLKGKDYILSPEGHYHGWADIFAAVSARDHGLPKSMKEYVERFPYNNLEVLEEKLKTEKFACVIMEPALLEAPQEGFLQGVRGLCDKYNALLIFDEMVTGFRWSLGGAQEYYGVVPDLATFGKACANGMPISILAGKKDVMMALDQVFFSGTYLGETLSIAAAVETINELKERKGEIYGHIWNTGNLIQKTFNDECDRLKLNGKMIGLGPVFNVKFFNEDAQGTKDLFHQEMVKNGIFWGNAIYITWAHQEKEIKNVLKAIKKSLKVVAKAVSNNNIDVVLEGERSNVIFQRTIINEPKKKWERV
jgi:glutamate-1-semialdehyde 2,1-aminomutase/spore coat polysaccharide biosynthesis protein SpsF